MKGMLLETPIPADNPAPIPADRPVKDFIGGDRRLIGGDRRFRVPLLLAMSLISLSVQAEVTITDAWVRGTVPAQTSTGAYMKIKSTEDAKIVAASSPAAKIVEIHEMAMANGVMEMKAVPALMLPAGKAVELKSGGYHVMMMELAKPLKAGDKVPITFTVEGKDGRKTAVEVKADVRPLGR